MDLDFLLHKIFEAQAIRIGGKWLDEHGNPYVDILVNNIPHYYGVVMPSRQEANKKKVSDDLRTIIAHESQKRDELTVMVVGIVKGATKEGPYEAIATHDMIRERAEEVVMSKKVFYGSYMFDSSKKSQPVMRIYTPDSKEDSNAILVPIDMDRVRGNLIRLKEEFEYNRLMDVSFPGDRFLIRKITNPSLGFYFCSRLFCFLKEDNAKAPDGTQLLTKPLGFTKGHEIQDLVIVSTNKDKGIGYVPIPGPKAPYYMKVIVHDAADIVGKYLRKVEIIDNKNMIIEAKIAK